MYADIRHIESALDIADRDTSLEVKDNYTTTFESFPLVFYEREIIYWQVGAQVFHLRRLPI